MARRKSGEKELDDIMECSICTEIFTDPRLLPCQHTFCLECLLKYGEDRQPRDTMLCPMCRKDYTVPDDGLPATQKNFFMQKIILARKLSAGNEAHQNVCDACSRGKACTDETAKPATMYCVQCQDSYCEQCSLTHRNMTCSSDHSQLEIGKPQPEEEVAMKLPVATCELHKGKEIEVFCKVCELAICMMCFIKSHKNHDCSDLEEVSADLRRQTKSDVDRAKDQLARCQQVLPRVVKVKTGCISQLADVEGEINRRADKLINDVQRERRKLLSEVETIRQKQVKQVEMLKQELEQHMTEMKSFTRYSETLLSSGTACDVARSATSLHQRADELTMFDVVRHVENSVPTATVKFTPAVVVTRQAGNLVGFINTEACDTAYVLIRETVSAPTVCHVIPRSKCVGGVMSLGDGVFVVRYDIPHVEVYDAGNFTIRRRLKIPGLGSRPLGLAVCAVNKCLYASDFDKHSVHRVELSGSNAVMKWSVARGPVGLTVNSSHNVLVVSQGERKLQEFTTRGSLVRNIQLQPDLGQSQQVVQLSTDKFLVSHRGSLHRVCQVDATGAVVRSYGGPQGSAMTRMDCPAGLALDAYNNVLIADQWNNRLLMLDASLRSAHEVSVFPGRGLKYPCRLHYDESRRRLYAGEGFGVELLSLITCRTSTLTHTRLNIHRRKSCEGPDPREIVQARVHHCFRPSQNLTESSLSEAR